MLNPLALQAIDYVELGSDGGELVGSGYGVVATAPTAP